MKIFAQRLMLMVEIIYSLDKTFSYPLVYYGIGSASSGTHVELKSETIPTEICTWSYFSWLSATLLIWMILLRENK